ncbi:MAG: alpha 1,2-mannosyltransferase [Crocinitomix sp.]|jgi:alpha 1,2-mannosyltransferase
MFFINTLRRLFNPNAPHIFSEDCFRKVIYAPSFLSINRLKKNWKSHITTIPEYPGKFEGKGIVICGGGQLYFTCAWINISMLRKSGCKLPIELWHLEHELTTEIIVQLGELGVICKNINKHGGGDLENFALKPFSIINSAFQEILFLDADNNSLVDPTYLFDQPEYLKHGTVFWPDFWFTEKSNPIWKVLELEPIELNEQESGQILIDKKRYWKELNLCLYFNKERKYYYKMLHGDKDTFKFAWLALKSKYYMIKTPVGHCGLTDPRNGYFFGSSMVQHDFKGEILFLHRNMLKWFYSDENEKIWKEIVRFKKNPTDKKMIRHFENEISYFCIGGDVDVMNSEDLLGAYEADCLSVLKTLRESKFYKDFL